MRPRAFRAPTCGPFCRSTSRHANNLSVLRITKAAVFPVNKAAGRFVNKLGGRQVNKLASRRVNKTVGPQVNKAAADRQVNQTGWSTR